MDKICWRCLFIPLEVIILSLGMVSLFGQEVTSTPSTRSVDEVTFQTSDQSIPQSVRGTIQSITGLDGLTIEPLGSSKPLVIPMSYVLQIDTPRSPLLLAADEAMAIAKESGQADDYKKSLNYYVEARKESNLPLWKRHWLTARIVECHSALGNQQQAIAEFFLLCHADAFTPYLSAIPLPWLPASTFVDPMSRMAMEQIALKWLDSKNNPTGYENPIGQLLAAALLLESNGPAKNQAIEVLRRLVVYECPIAHAPHLSKTCDDMALLATAQLWRTRFVADLKPVELQRWTNTIDKLSPELRGGPLLLLGKGLRLAGQHDSAQQTFLKAAILFPAVQQLAERELTTF